MGRFLASFLPNFLIPSTYRKKQYINIKKIVRKHFKTFPSFVIPKHQCFPWVYQIAQHELLIIIVNNKNTKSVWLEKPWAGVSFSLPSLPPPPLNLAMALPMLRPVLIGPFYNHTQHMNNLAHTHKRVRTRPGEGFSSLTLANMFAASRTDRPGDTMLSRGEITPTHHHYHHH